MKTRKTTALLALCLMAGTAFGQKNGATVTVDAGSLETKEMRLIDGADMVKVAPGTDGMFTFHLKGEFPKRISISIDKPKRGMLSTYVENGDDLKIVSTFDRESPSVFSGKGAANARTASEIYRSLAAIWKGINKEDVQAGNANDLYKRFDAMFQQGFDMLEASKGEVTPGFYKDEHAMLYYQRVYQLLQAPFWYMRLTGKKLSESIPDGYWDLAKLVKMDDKQLGTEAYDSVMSYGMSDYFAYQYKFEHGNPDGEFPKADIFMAQYRAAEKMFTGKTRSTMLRGQIVNRLAGIQVPDAAPVKALLDEYVNKYASLEDPRDIQALQDIYNTCISLVTGHEPPAFVLKDMNGKDVTLKDFAGKVVYMDFWASWCGPCRQQMKEGAPTLHKFFASNKDMVFMYINLDKEAAAGKKAIAEDRIEGVHLFAGDFNPQNPIAKAFNIGGIPHYVIIGKDGKIFQNNAPRPSQDETPRRLLEALTAD